jgi:hypothetical protein
VTLLGGDLRDIQDGNPWVTHIHFLYKNGPVSYRTGRGGFETGRLTPLPRYFTMRLCGSAKEDGAVIKFMYRRFFWGGGTGVQTQGFSTA